MGTYDHPWADGKRARTITKRHRALVWENMLGTVYAKNAAGQVQYFDYDYAAAHSWAGTAGCSDLRVSRAPETYADCPRKGQVALYGLRGGS
jgi:hypothetical protein